MPLTEHNITLHTFCSNDHLLFAEKEVKSDEAWTSVTRWLDYLFNIQYVAIKCKEGLPNSKKYLPK